MTIYYSITTNGFYDTDIASYTLPSDAITVTDAQRATLRAGQSIGESIAIVNGVPVNVPYVATSAQLWAAYQAKAQLLLDKSDLVAIRCLKAGVAFPANWLSYVTSLRAIIGASTGDATVALPATPTYPVGT